MKEKICCINTNIEIHHYRFPQTVATTPHYSSELLIERTRGPITTTTTCYFPTISLSDPDRAVFAYIISHAYHQRKTERERWLAISAISDLKLAKRKYFTAESGVLLYEEGDIDRAYQYIQRSLEDAFCNARLRTYEISKMMPIISEANQHQNKTNQKLLLLASVSLLTAILLIVLILLFKQMKKLKGHKGI
jgi:hypothetical protein